jgi:hypothetical protein
VQYYFPELKMTCFPDSLVESGGEQLIHILYCLFGRKGEVERIKLAFQKDQLPEKVEHLGSLLLFLKRSGAQLNHIREWHLLTYQEYQAFSRLEGSPIRLSGKQFQQLSCDSWAVLFYQVLRVFYIGRFSKPPKPADKDCAPSNLYSQAELFLLRWLETSTDSRLNSFKQFNLELISRLLAAYSNSLLQEPPPALDDEPVNRFYLLSEFSLSMGFSASDFEKFN